jgi:DNA replication protein DnaC
LPSFEVRFETPPGDQAQVARTSLLIVDEIGYLPVIPGGGNLFFQLVNARYERAAMILTSNRGFAEWSEVFGDAVVATALLDRL